MSTVCGRPQGGHWTHVDRGEGGQKREFYGRHKWMAPYQDSTKRKGQYIFSF